MLLDPDDLGDRGMDGPDASLSCKKSDCGRCAGTEQQRRQGRQDGREQDPPTRPERLRGGGHSLESDSPQRPGAGGAEGGAALRVGRPGCWEPVKPGPARVAPIRLPNAGVATASWLAPHFVLLAARGWRARRPRLVRAPMELTASMDSTSLAVTLARLQFIACETSDIWISRVGREDET